LLPIEEETKSKRKSEDINIKDPESNRVNKEEKIKKEELEETKREKIKKEGSLWKVEAKNITKLGKR